MKRRAGCRPASGFHVAIGALFVIGAAGSAYAQGQPPPGWRHIQVRPHVFAPAEVLKAGTYTVWVRIGDFPPGKEVDSNKVTRYTGGPWTKYVNIDFSRGGQPRHVTIYPDMIHHNTVNVTDFRDPRYGVPGKDEFILHIDNRSPTDTVTYVFQRMTGGSDHDTNPPTTGASLGSVWHESENGWSGVWTRRGSSNVFDAVWTKAGQSLVTKGVLTMTQTDANHVTIYRKDTSQNAEVDYTGTIDPNGSVTGTGKVRGSASTHQWSATIQ